MELHLVGWAPLSPGEEGTVTGGRVKEVGGEGAGGSWQYLEKSEDGIGIWGHAKSCSAHASLL